MTQHFSETFAKPTPKDPDLVMPENTTAYINAGGRGVRLSSIFHPHERRGGSKALLPVGKPPISLLEHHINKLKKAGVATIIAGVGDHENVAQYVIDRYKDNSILPVYYPNQLGNGGDIIRAIRDYPGLFPDDVLIINVDTLLDIKESKLINFHRTSSADISIALTLNRGVPNEDAFYVDATDRILYSAEATTNPITLEAALGRCAYRASSTGTLVAKTEMLRSYPWDPGQGDISLYKDIVGAAIARQAMAGYNNGEGLFIDVGTVSTWHEVQENHAIIAAHIHY